MLPDQHAAFLAENQPHFRAELSAQIRAALGAAGLDIYPAEWDEVLVELVLVHAAEVRCRVADLIGAATAGAYCEADQERFERITYAILNHRVGPEGGVSVPEMDSDLEPM